MEFQVHRDLPVLQRTPAVLRTLLQGMPGDWTRANYGPGTWSPHEVIGHLIHGELTDWIPRARIILSEATAKHFEPFDRAGHERMCAAASTDELLVTFARLRDENLTVLRALPLDDRSMARRGVHPAFGEVTMAQLLATWVVHDLNHIAQVCKAMAAQHRAEVGPWEAYLSILAPPAPR